MFSDRLFRILYILTKQGNKFGSSFIAVNLESRTFEISDDLKIISRMKRNYILLLVWTFATLALVGKYRSTGMTERFNITLFFWMMSITALTAYSIHRWYSTDLVRAMNFLLVLFRHLQSILKYDQDYVLISKHSTKILFFLFRNVHAGH